MKLQFTKKNSKNSKKLLFLVPPELASRNQRNVFNRNRGRLIEKVKKFGVRECIPHKVTAVS